MLTYIGEVSNSGMAMRLEITTDINDVVSSGDVPSSELVSGDFIPRQKIFLPMRLTRWQKY